MVSIGPNLIVIRAYVRVKNFFDTRQGNRYNSSRDRKRRTNSGCHFGQSRRSLSFAAYVSAFYLASLG